MSLLRRAELRVGLCPERLVLRDRIVAGTGLDEFRVLAPRRAPLVAILSNHFVRYAVLPASSDLVSEAEWLAYARHEFATTYGSASADWDIRICATGRAGPKVASAVDRALLESLRKVPALVSVQPYLMAAFNARRKVLRRSTSWFVLQEPGRVTLALFTGGVWQLIRTRQVQEDWRDRLPDLLDRETAASGQPFCERVVICCEEAVPPRLGRYEIHDATVLRDADRAARSYVMALH